MRSYSINSEVAWGDILQLLRWRIHVLKGEASHSIACFNEAINHNYPEFIAYHRASACDTCDKLLHLFNVLNGLRKFLRYKPCSYSDLDLVEVITFYETESQNVSSGDIIRPDSSCIQPLI